MTTPRIKRKLAAVLHADIKDYSRLMAENETDTLRTLTSHREVLFGMVELHGGRVVDTAGDGFLLEFSSVVDAVAFAVEFQREIWARNARLPQDRRLEFRIGINVGDVIEEGENIYGDGVNIAARLEALAEPGGICISGTAYDQLRRKLTLDYEFLGERTVKNIPEPVRAYRVRMESSGAEAEPPQPKIAPARRMPWTALVAGAAIVAVVAAIGLWYFYGPASRATLRTPAGPALTPIQSEALRLVVLPFTQSKGDPSEVYFGEGLSADISATFATIPGLFIIAPHSAFAFRSRPVDVNAVREKLAVTHILEGSFFRDGDRVKIKTWLRDAAKGSEVWTQSYDPMDKDVFTVRREVPLAVIGALDVVIPDSARARLIDKSPPTKNAEAYTRFVQGLACYHHGGKELHARAQELFEQAVALDPNYAEACAVLARSYLQGARLGWSKQPALALAKSLELTEKALSLDNSLEAAHLNMATLKLMRHEHDSAVAQAEKAVAMCPGYADTLATVGMIMVCVGRPEDGLKLATRAMRLNPITPSFYFHVVGDAYMDTKQYDEAVAAYNKGLLNHPDNVALRTRLVAAYIVTGKEKEAREAATELVRRSPAFSLARLAKQMPCKSYPHGEQFMEALRKAGLK